jgi:signal transduction histidine kinase
MNKLARQIWNLDNTYRLKHAYELFPKPIADEFLKSDRTVLETGQPITFVAPGIRNDGSQGFYMLHKFILPLNTTKRLVAGQAIDITEEVNMREEKKKMEATLLRQKIQKQKDISRAIMTAQDHISNELGKELHDNVIQILASAHIMLEYSGKEKCKNRENFIEKSRRYVRSAMEEIREISKSLNTSMISEVGFIKPVEEILSNMKLNRPIKELFECDPALEQVLSGEQKLMLYRIIQEQTNNIIKHAEASEVTITLKRKADSLFLVLRDNGKGFDLDRVKRGIGLSNIRNRVEAFNGSLKIISAPGKGCCMEVTIPTDKR